MKVFGNSSSLISNISSWVSGFSIGFLVFGVGFMIFETFSTSINHSGFPSLRSAFPSTSEDFSYVSRSPLKGPGYPPIFAYYISGTRGESAKIMRLLKAVYHPRNRYLLHLDADATDYERLELALSVEEKRTFRAFRNVDVLGRSNALDQKGSSAVAATLHAAALFLKVYKDWDWFINLSASDYPIVTQDDLLHAFTLLPKDLNFIHFYNATDWKEQTDVKRIVVDPNLYVQKNSEIFHAADTRDAPDAFRVFKGSPSGFLTRAFMEYCIQGWDNLPRKLLMYFTNVVGPLEFYFHTVVCNSDDFRNTTVNDNLRYMVLEIPKQDPSLNNVTGMVQSTAAFTRHFQEDGEVLKKLDDKILKRPPDGLVPGKWCLRPALNRSTEDSNLNACYSWGSINTVEPGPRGRKLANFLSKLASERTLRSKQCSVS